MAELPQRHAISGLSCDYWDEGYSALALKLGAGRTDEMILSFLQGRTWKSYTEYFPSNPICRRYYSTN